MGNNFRWFDQKATEDSPAQRGFLSKLGGAAQGIAAPLAAAYGNDSGFKQLQLNQQQDQADMEFQKYLASKRISEGELDLKKQDSANAMAMMAMHYGVSPDQFKQLLSGQSAPIPNSPMGQLPQGPLPPNAGMSMINGGIGNIQSQQIQPPMSMKGQMAPPNGLDSIRQQMQTEMQGMRPQMDASGKWVLKPAESEYQKQVMNDKIAQKDQSQWSNFIKQNTPDTASSRSTFGIASRSNLQAGRVIQTLKDNPNVTYQDLGNVVADLAGIYQGGAPTDQGMKHQQYESLKTNIANLKQFATGKPQNAVPPEIVKKLIGVAQQTIDLNKTVLNKHFDAQEKAQAKLISKYPEEWKAFREQAAQDYMGGSDTPTQSTGGWNDTKESRYQELLKKQGGE